MFSDPKCKIETVQKEDEEEKKEIIDETNRDIKLMLYTLKMPKGCIIWQCLVEGIPVVFDLEHATILRLVTRVMTSYYL